MVKIVSYRQKLIELAKIYKIDKVFDRNVKLTTYDIEIILLKNTRQKQNPINWKRFLCVKTPMEKMLTSFKTL